MDQRPTCKMQNYNTPRRKPEEKLPDIGFGNDLLDITLKAQTTKENINKLDYIQI